MKTILLTALVLVSFTSVGQRSGRASISVGSSIGIYSTPTNYLEGITSINASLTWSKLKGGIMATYFSDGSFVPSYNLSFNAFNKRARFVDNTIVLGAGNKDFMIGVGMHAHAFNLFGYIRQNYKKENGSWGIILQVNLTHQSGKKSILD